MSANHAVICWSHLHSPPSQRAHNPPLGSPALAPVWEVTRSCDCGVQPACPAWKETATCSGSDLMASKPTQAKHSLKNASAAAHETCEPRKRKGIPRGMKLPLIALVPQYPYQRLAQMKHFSYLLSRAGRSTEELQYTSQGYLKSGEKTKKKKKKS